MIAKSRYEADIPEDRQTHAEALYDVLSSEYKKRRKKVRLDLKNIDPFATLITS